MKKRLLALVLALATVTAGTAVTASAADYLPEAVKAQSVETVGLSSGNYSYEELEDGTVSIRKYNGYNETDVVIPSEIEGKKVTALSDFAFSSAKIESVVIPDSITTFGKDIFFDSENLKSAKLPDNMTAITYGMFDSCENLKSVNMPKSLTTIEKRAFIYTALESITIPEGVTSIGESAFWECKELKSVSLPSTLKKMDDNVFWKCESLTTFVLPDGFTEIPNGLLNGCTNLNAIEIPASVQKVGSIGLFQCPNVANVYFTGSEEEFQPIKSDIEWYLKNPTVHFNSHLPDDYVVQPKSGTDSENTDTSTEDTDTSTENTDTSTENTDTATDNTDTSTENTDTVTDNTDTSTENTDTIIEKCKVTFDSNGGDEIPSITVDKGTVLRTSVVIPLPKRDGYGYTGWYLGDEKFDFNTPITEDITLVAQWVKTGGDDTSSDTATDDTDTNTQNTDTATDNSDTSTENTDTSTENKDTATDTEENKDFGYAENIDAKDGSISITSYNGSDVDVVVPSMIDGHEVTRIDNYAFNGNTNITSVKLPDTVTEIGRSVFKDCSSLESVDIPDTVTKIEKYAFEDCTSLESVTIPEGVTRIEPYTFANCPSLKTVVLPDSLTDIDSNAFSQTNNVTVICSPGSAAEKFAQDHQIPYAYPESEKIGILGDLNGDNKVTAKDSMIIQRYSVNLLALDDKQLKLGDVDGNNKVTNADALNIMRYTVHALIKYPIGEEV